MWFKDYIVQNINIQIDNTKFKCGVWKTPDGKFIRGKLSENIQGHYGNTLKSYILSLHYDMHVPQNKIHAHICEMGIQVSSGEINRILSANQDIFHAEKEEVLQTGLQVSPFVVVDDTGHRHKGVNGYCTHIGNDLFAYFQSSKRKNRINFLEILSGPDSSYKITGFSLAYYKKQKLTNSLFVLLKRAQGKVFKNKEAWEEFLKRLGIKDKHHKVITEGALLGNLLYQKLNSDFVIVSDDAGQFDIFWHALCWVHTERIITSINTVSNEQNELINNLLDNFWDFFKDLHKYKLNPLMAKRVLIEAKFDEIFSIQTNFPSLNKACKAIKDKKSELLVVLDKPEIPLTNNESERTIRDVATKRKISAGTRSDIGRQCRDTFLSLKKTCAKYDISFSKYIYDRLTGEARIPPLKNLMEKKASIIYNLTPTF